MWSCCGSRDPKKNRYIIAGDKAGTYQVDQMELKDPQDTEVEVEVAYVSLNSHDKAGIVASKGIGHSFSGVIKAVGKSIPVDDKKVAIFAKGDKVYGFYKGDTGALSEFINVAATSVVKVPSGVDMKTAAALPHIVHVSNQLTPLLAKDKKVNFSGPKGGYYESLFTAVAKQNTASIQANADAPVDFFFHAEGGKSEVKPENYTQAWSMESAVHTLFGEGKKFAPKEYTAGDLAAAKAFGEKAENSAIFKNISWANGEKVSSKDDLIKAFEKLSKDGQGPIIVDVDVLKSLPEKPVPVVVKPEVVGEKPTITPEKKN